MEVRFLGRNHGLTTADIEAKAKAKREVGELKVSAAAGKTKAVASGKNKAAPKHLHPKARDLGRAWPRSSLDC